MNQPNKERFKTSVGGQALMVVHILRTVMMKRLVNKTLAVN